VDRKPTTLKDYDDKFKSMVPRPIGQIATQVKELIHPPYKMPSEIRIERSPTPKEIKEILPAEPVCHVRQMAIVLR
jgi:hypothetical protein